ncbi:MAG TPA: SRPBCC domain-containing protein [Dysgonomonas sp.]|nr:SRPBCC domain-containing protein [Dysgonomonas sp.]
MDNKEFVFIEQEFNAPIDKVWKAITFAEELEHWFFEIDEFELKQGFVFTFYEGGEEEKYLHICRILEIMTLAKLSYSWKYQDIDGNSTVSFYLNKQDEKTLLKLVHEGINSFRNEKPDFTKEYFEKKWNNLINYSLKEFIENN